MTRQQQTRVIIIVVGVVVVVALGAIVASRMFRVSIRTVRGTITRVDVPSRTASLAIIHPKTGETLQVEGTAPPGCEIRIDDKPAELADLRVGDQVTVEGTIRFWNMSVTANWVHVRRADATPAGTTASAPNTPTTATATPTSAPKPTATAPTSAP